MSDQLEDFIRKNKEAFDDKSASDKVWSSISAGLEKEVKKKSDGFALLWKAAAVFFFLTSLWFVFEKLQTTGEEPTLAEEVTSPEYQEFVDADAYYTALINQKKSEIEEFRLANTNLEEEFLQDVNNLDAMYEELKNELKNFQHNEKLMDAVIRNLQLRVEILNQQISLLQKIKEKKENSGTVSI